MDVTVNVSIGELLDKISVLEIKSERIKDKNKLKEINKELLILTKVCKQKLKDYKSWIEKLKKVNEILWDLENKTRQKENEKKFDEEFIELARKVYQTNDLRFSIKNDINNFYGSEIKEQKYFE